MKWLSIDYILKLHKKIIYGTGGVPGIRDITLLQSAIYNAQPTFDGQDLYRDIESKIAAVASESSIIIHSLTGIKGWGYTSC